MLQSLLAARFDVKVHRERKEVPAYALAPAKNGPKLKESPAVPADAEPGAKVNVSVRSEDGFPITPPGAHKPADGDSHELDDRSQDFSVALQTQLGLKLAPDKTEIELLIIDHVDRVPSGN